MNKEDTLNEALKAIVGDCTELAFKEENYTLRKKIHVYVNRERFRSVIIDYTNNYVIRVNNLIQYGHHASSYIEAYEQGLNEGFHQGRDSLSDDFTTLLNSPNSHLLIHKRALLDTLRGD